MIAIIDYGMGNIGSVKNILRKVGAEDVIVTKEQKDIIAADKIILPGVGSFDAGVTNLIKYDLFDLIKEMVLQKKTPILGICLGMQLLGLYSEEGEKQGLGLLEFSCRRFRLPDVYKVPHMGWDYVKINQSPCMLTRNIPEMQRYYFVHSYHAVCENKENILMTCDYGYEFPAAVYKDIIFGVQFHPEKSHQFGMRLLRNFIGAENV